MSWGSERNRHNFNSSSKKTCFLGGIRSSSDEETPHSPPSRLPSRIGETLFLLTAGLVIVQSSPLLLKWRRRPSAGVLVAAVLKLLVVEEKEMLEAVFRLDPWTETKSTNHNGEHFLIELHHVFFLV